jgi:hypothetical protein
MSSDLAVGFGDLIAYYDVRAQEIAAAQAIVTAKTRGTAISKGLGVASASQQTQDTTPRRITLELLQSATPSNSNNTTTPAQVPNADGLRTIASVSVAQVVAQLTFDVSRNSNGYAQTVEITESARQSVHNTAGGFYVDEFGYSPGSLNVSVWVLYNTVPGQQVQVFFDLLSKAKLTQPLSNEIPLRLRFHDSYLQRSLIITQDSVRLQADVEAPNRARLSIAATILYDYSDPSAPPQSALTPGQAAATQVANGLLSLGTMLSPAGALIGATIGATVAST